MLRSFQPRTGLRRQRGFSIIELSIAVLIALFLLGGLVTLVMGTRRSSGTQSALAALQDNQRIAMTLITNVVQMAGYFPTPTSQQLSSFNLETFGAITLNPSQVVDGTYNGSAPGDTFAVRYFAPALDTTGSIINCAGQSNTSTATNLWYTNVFQIGTVNGTSWLQCAVRSNNNGTLSPVLTVNLIPNVTSISVLYGVGSTAGAPLGDYSVVQYLNASQMTNINWLNVTSVKVTLTFQLPQYGTVGGQMMATSAPHSTTTIQRVIPIMSRAGVNVI